MKTDGTSKQIQFGKASGRNLVASFDAEHITSNGGLVLLHEVDRQWGVLKRLAGCFRDHRAPDLIRHPVEQLLRQRVFGIVCGHEDLNDHEALREDPLLAAVVGKHAGQVIVADGTLSAARRLERVLTTDPGMGVVRHVDAGYPQAIRCG